MNFSLIDLAPFFLQLAAILSVAYFPFSCFFKISIKVITLTIFLLVTFAFVILIFAHVLDDFQLANVYYNSHTSKPLLYKIFGVWGNHEGSILLWIWIMTIYAMFLEFSLNDSHVKVVSLSIQNFVIGLFLIFCVFSSDPFVKITPVPMNGLGFNPILQDLALAIHPPTLYLGYVGFSTVFSISLASLIARKTPMEWAIIVKPWCMISWLFLTLGIGLGSWWAYRELGWGGFWFWDPVENSSLMPWLLSTAFIHSRLVVKKSGRFFNLSIFLAIFTFIVSLIATFLVRSGLLISVHTFANDSDRGVYLLLLICIILIFSFLVYSFFSFRDIGSTRSIKCLSKSMLLLLSNAIFITAFFIIFIGTFYPIILEFFANEVIAIGEYYYIFFFRILVVMMLTLMILVLKLDYYEDNKLFKILYRYRISFLFSIIATIVLSAQNVLTSTILFLGSFLFFAVIEDYLQKIFYLNNRFKAIQSISRSYYSMMCSHIGIAFLIIGIVCSTAWQVKKELYMKEGDSVEIGNFIITFSRLIFVKNNSYDSLKGVFFISNTRGEVIGKATPESRFYLVEKVRNTESSIYRYFLSDIYILMGDMNENMKIAVCIYYKPYINLIWLGVLFMVIGGIISMFFRVKK